MSSTERPTLLCCGVLMGTPTPEDSRNLPQSMQGLTHRAAEAGASQGSQREPVSRQDKSPSLFYHFEQEYNLPSFHIPRSWVKARTTHPLVRHSLSQA